MANWVVNQFSITGNNELLNQLKNAAKHDPTDFEWINYMGYESANNSLFSLSRLYPEPKVLLDKEYDLRRNNSKVPDDLKNWRREHWGVGGDIFDVVEKTVKSELWEIEFSSLWAPPLNAFQHISCEFNELTFDLVYCDLIGGFQGRALVKKGNLLLNEHEEWNDLSGTNSKK